MAFLFVLGALAFASFLAAQAPPAPQTQDETRFASRAEVVAVDLVVRDKKGRLVTDLRQDEVEVLEDGVPQKIRMSRFQRGAGVGDLSQAESVALVNALITLVDGLKSDAGRETVLLFSEGFTVPAGCENVFDDLQSRANRANVSLYGIDVRGLQLSTQLGSSGAALATSTAISASQRGAGSESAATREQMTQDDTVQSSLRADVVDTLAHLSTSTGGFLVTQTNDFGRPLGRIAEDIRGYYEASYVPSAAAAPDSSGRSACAARKDA